MQALDPEFGSSAPPLDAFLPDLKNPCWMVDGEARCLPGVILTGSFQAGANAIADKLTKHRDVVTNEMTRWQFWGEEGKKLGEYSQKFGQALPQLQTDPKKKVLLDTSLSTFAFYWAAGLKAHQHFQQFMRGCHHNCSTNAKGDMDKHNQCMDTICFPEAHAKDVQAAEQAGFDFDDVHMPLMMSAVYGRERAPKLLMVLRNPIDRLYTAYWSHPHYKGKYGQTPEGFLDYVKEQVGAMHICESKGHSMRDCALYFETYTMQEEGLFFHADQIVRGMYSVYIEVWLRHFPRENIMLIQSEEYFKNPEGMMDKIFDFLGMERPEGGDRTKVSLAGNKESHAGSKPPMPEEAKKLLESFYAPWNANLDALLKDTTFASSWKSAGRAAA